MRGLQKAGRASCSICMVLILYFQPNAASLSCSLLNGCMACTQQPQPSIPQLPPGYKVTPQMLAARSQLAVNPPASPESALKVVAESVKVAAAAQPENESKFTSALSALRTAGSKIFGKRRRLLQGFGGLVNSPISSAFLGTATPAEYDIRGASSGFSGLQQQQQQQVVPQLPMPSNAITVASASNAASSEMYVSSDQRMVHAASMPMVMAAPAAGGSSMNTGVPLMFPVVPQQQGMNILVTDPRNTTGPHPWDVLLFKTNQFNTSRPAYRMGGLGLMLMSDFNKSQPLTDWRVIRSQEQQQKPAGLKYWIAKNFARSNAAGFDASTTGIDTGSATYISSGSGSGSRLAAPPASDSSGAPVFGFGGLMSKQPPGLGELTLQFTPRFSSFFKPPTAVLDGDKLAARVGIAAAAANGTSVRLWCTACQAPAYQLTAYGSCVCAAGYGRVMDSKTPYACVKCPSGQAAVTATPAAAPTGKPTPIKLQPAGTTEQADEPEGSNKPVLAICQQCTKGTVPNQAQTACVVP